MKIINVLFALILAVGVFLPFNTPVQAATATLAITGEGTLTSGIYLGGGTWANLNSNDGETSYLEVWDTASGSHTYNMADFVDGYASIDSVTLYVNGRSITSSGGGVPYSVPFNHVCYLGGSSYKGSADGFSDFSWVTHSYTWTTNPSTSSPWTSTALNSAEFGFYKDSNYEARVSWMYLVVTYTSPSSPTVTTQAVSVITPTTATGNGNVTSDGGNTITSRGTVIAVAANPTTADHTDNVTGTTGAFTTSITGLTKGTLYHVRAYAKNGIGTSYGADESFTTIDDPTITTTAASLIATTTARFNSQVTFDGAAGGGEACTVTFVYKAGSPFANYAAILAAGGTEVVAAGTYTVGQFPNYDVAGLTLGTLYSFAVKIVNSTTTVAYGSVLTFTTSNGISNTTALTAIPTSTTVSLAWVKGTGAGFTLVRYSASAYPATTADGTVAYLGVGNSYMLTGLTPGTSYYFSAWGKTGALYSAGYVTAMATTLAFDTAVSTGTIEAPPSNAWWNQTPSTTKVSSIPLVSGLVSANATAYAIPEASLWYFLWVLFSVGVGVFIYSKSGNNLSMSLGAQALLFALGAVLGLVMLWIMVLFMIIGAGFTLWGDRR